MRKRAPVHYMCNTRHQIMNKGERFLFWSIASWGIYIAYIGVQYAISIS